MTGLVVFGVAFVVGAGLLALWVDLRFPKLAPADTRGALSHLAVAFVFSDVVARLLGDTLVAAGLPGSRVGAVIGIVLPGLAYTCLAVLWLARVVQRSMRGSLL